MPQIDWNLWQQAIGIIVFIIFVAIIVLNAVFLCAEAIINAVQKKPQRSFGPHDRVVAVIASLGSICVAYGYFVEPYWLSVERVKIYSPKLIPDSSPIRIVQISDIHSDEFSRLEEKLPAAIAELKPDVIVFTGDAINSPSGLPIFRKLMTKLAKIAPTFVVKGNWDSRFFKNCERFANTGVHELREAPTSIRVNKNEIWLCGLPVDTSYSVRQIMSKVPAKKFSIFLFHYPDCLPEMAENHVDLYLAGHTHGGQIAMPFYGALATMSAFGKKYESGLYKMDDTYLYVNRGIGMEGGSAPRLRFCAKPEITLIQVSGRE